MCASLMPDTVLLVFESDGHKEAVGCELRIRQWHKGLVAVSEGDRAQFEESCFSRFRSFYILACSHGKEESTDDQVNSMVVGVIAQAGLLVGPKGAQ